MTNNSGAADPSNPQKYETQQTPGRGTVTKVETFPDGSTRWVVDAAPGFAPIPAMLQGGIQPVPIPSPALPDAEELLALRKTKKQREIFHRRQDVFYLYAIKGLSVDGIINYYEMKKLSHIPHDRRTIERDLAYINKHPDIFNSERVRGFDGSSDG